MWKKKSQQLSHIFTLNDTVRRSGTVDFQQVIACVVHSSRALFPTYYFVHLATEGQ